MRINIKKIAMIFRKNKTNTLLITSFGIIVASFVFIVLHYFTVKSALEEQLQNNFTNFQNRVYSYFEEEAKNISILTDHAILQKPEIIQEFVSSNRDSLYKKTLPLYESLQEKYHKNLAVMHFYKPEVQSFLRMHKPEKYGDTTKDHRPMLSYIDSTKTKVAQTGFEAGLFSFSYRVEVPLFLKENYIGILDYGLEANELINAIFKDSSVFVAVALKKAKAEAVKYHEIQAKNDEFVLYSSTNELFKNVKTLDCESKMRYFDYDGKNYVIYSIPLKDFYSNTAAYCLVAKDITSINNELKRDIYIFIFLALLVLAINIVFFNKSYTPMIDSLLRQKKLLSRAQSLAKLGYFEVDLSTLAVECSSEFCAIIHAKRPLGFDEIKERFIAEDLEKFEKNIEEALKSGYFEEIKCAILNPDNKKRILRVQGELRYDKKGAPDKLMCVVLDISQTECLIQELKELSQELEARVEKEIEIRRKQEMALMEQSRLASMGELIQSISHHWRQPLAAVSLIVQDIEEAYEYGELDKEYISTSVASAHLILEKMSKTIDHFREFVKKDQEREYFDVIKAIEEVVRLQKDSLSQDEIHLLLENKIDGVEKAFVVGYPSEFKQVLLNIIQNAKEAILINKLLSDRKIEIVLTKSENKISIAIKDSGGGIDESYIDKIFDPYFTKKKDNGTGIGLYMAKTLLEKHMHGSISAQNVEKGAIFTILLDMETTI